MAYGLSTAPSFSERGEAPAHGFCGCCCCMTFSFLLFAIIIVGITLLFILVMRPTKPHFDLQSVSIQGFHVDRQEMRVYLSMNVTLVFRAMNPNKMAILYSATDLNCLYNTTLIGVAKVPVFHQPAHSRTILTAVVGVDQLNVLQPSSMDLVNDVTLNDRVPLSINGPVKARVRILGISTPRVKVFVHCQVVIRPQEMGVESRECNADR